MAETASIIDRLHEIDKHRAMALVAAGNVTCHDASQTHFTVRPTSNWPYTVHIHDDGTPPDCDCIYGETGRICDHIAAAFVWKRARQYVLDLAEKHNSDPATVANRLATQIANAKRTYQFEFQRKLKCIVTVARQLSTSPAEYRELVIEYHAADDRGFHAGNCDALRVVAVIEDGFAREPLDADDPRAVFAEMRTDGFYPTLREWIDVRGAVRRRREVYAKRRA